MWGKGGEERYKEKGERKIKEGETKNPEGNVASNATAILRGSSVRPSVRLPRNGNRGRGKKEQSLSLSLSLSLSFSFDASPRMSKISNRSLSLTRRPRRPIPRHPRLDCARISWFRAAQECCSIYVKGDLRVWLFSSNEYYAYGYYRLRYD